MRYLLCLFLPPIALLTVGKWGQAILNIFLCLFFWIPGVIHAVLVVNKFYADRRHQEMVGALKSRGIQ